MPTTMTSELRRDALPHINTLSELVHAQHMRIFAYLAAMQVALHGMRLK